MKRTERSRRNLLATAANAWFRAEEIEKGPPKLEWIAEQVNKTHDKDFGRRWVSQNLKKIQELVDELRNAKFNTNLGTSAEKGLRRVTDRGDCTHPLQAIFRI